MPLYLHEPAYQPYPSGIRPRETVLYVAGIGAVLLAAEHAMLLGGLLPIHMLFCLASLAFAVGGFIWGRLENEALWLEAFKANNRDLGIDEKILWHVYVTGWADYACSFQQAAVLLACALRNPDLEQTPACQKILAAYRHLTT